MMRENSAGALGKLLCWCVLIACGLWGSGAWASQLSQLQKQEIQAFSETLKQAHGQQVVVVADKISGAGLTDATLHKQIAHRIVKEYKLHLASPKDRDIMHRVGALMRAYASFGRPDSKPVLDALFADHQPRPFRERSMRLLRKLDWYAKRNHVMQNPSTYRSGMSLTTHRFLNLIASSDISIRRWAMEEIGRHGGAEKLVYDSMEEILRREINLEHSNTHLDFLAWICKLFVRYDYEQRKDVLLMIQNGPYSPKLQRYATKRQPNT